MYVRTTLVESIHSGATLGSCSHRTNVHLSLGNGPHPTTPWFDVALGHAYRAISFYKLSRPLRRCLAIGLFGEWNSHWHLRGWDFIARACVSISVSLFFSLSTATAISHTVSSKRFISSWDLCVSSLALNCLALKAYYYSRRTLISLACGSALGSYTSDGDRLIGADASKGLHRRGGQTLHGY